MRRFLPALLLALSPAGFARAADAPPPDAFNYVEALQKSLYKFPNCPEPVYKEAYRRDPADPPAQDVMDSQFNEVALDYNAGFTASLAWLCAGGRSAGHPLPDVQFPPRETRNESTDLRTTDREFFVSARELSRTADGVEIEATLHNRSRWPSRVCDRLSFRYVFALDGGTTREQVKAGVTGAKTARAGAVTSLSGTEAYVEVAYPGDAIYPGTLKTGQRTVRLKLSAPSWDPSNDWSHDGMAVETRLRPRIAVYDADRRVGGDDPPHN